MGEIRIEVRIPPKIVAKALRAARDKRNYFTILIETIKVESRIYFGRHPRSIRSCDGVEHYATFVFYDAGEAALFKLRFS